MKSIGLNSSISTIIIFFCLTSRISLSQGYNTRNPCPEPCTCHIFSSQIVIDCNDKNLFSFPTLVGLEEFETDLKVALYLNRNSLKYVLTNSLYPIRGRLKVLEIESNENVIEFTMGALNPFISSLEVLKIDPLFDGPNEEMLVYKLGALKELSLRITTDTAKLVRSSISQIKGRSLQNELIDEAIEPSLEKLYIHHSDLSEIGNKTLSNLPLRVLDLSHNKLTSFPSVTYTLLSQTLTHLYLKKNEIEKLSHEHIPWICKLQVLDLSFNKLSTIQEGILERCPKLRELDLSRNFHLLELEPLVFRNLKNLKIDLSYTNVNHLDFLAPEQVNQLRVYGANIPCDCVLQREHLSKFGSKLEGTCRTKVMNANGSLDLGFEEHLQVCHVSVKRTRTRKSFIPNSKSEHSHIVIANAIARSANEQIGTSSAVTILDILKMRRRPPMTWSRNRSAVMKSNILDPEENRTETVTSHQVVVSVTPTEGKDNQLKQWFYECPVYIFACFVHGFLTFAAFLAPDHPKKMT